MSSAPEPEAAGRLPVRAVGSTHAPRRSRLGALLGTAASIAKRTPGFSTSLGVTERELARVEGLVWREVRNRMDAAAGPSPTGPAAAGSGPPDDAARDLLAQLLTISIEQSAQEARSRLFVSLLAQLQPDEARVLAALSDGSEYPVINVATRGSFGMSGPAVLENASTVGRAAGVALPDWVPTYVTHLQQLQLVSVGPESHALADGYEILLTEAVVRQAQADAGSRARILRRSLHQSPLGHELWAACAAPRRELESRPGSPV